MATKDKAENAAVVDYLEEKVTIQLFKDNGKYKDDVFVQLNGKTWLIKRGIPVTVPRKVALLLDSSQIQDQSAAEYAQSQQALYEQGKDRLN